MKKNKFTSCVLCMLLAVSFVMLPGCSKIGRAHV